MVYLDGTLKMWLSMFLISLGEHFYEFKND